MNQNDEHKTYLHFLKDEKFIDWKLFSTDELNSYWTEYLENHPEERVDFLLAEKHFRNIKLSSHQIPAKKKTQAIARLRQEVGSHSRRRKMRLYFGYAAASIAILLISTLFYFQMNNTEENLRTAESLIVGNELESEDIQLITSNKTIAFQENVDISVTDEGKAQVKKEKDGQAHEPIEVDRKALNRLVVPYGKRTTLTLADGSKVWLNSGSVLEFPAQFSEKNREIYLASGEMYIEVAPDRKKTFYVHTSDFKVKVTGTRFNLSTYSDNPQSVVLVEGSVSLQAENQREQQLSPNEQALLTENGAFKMQTVDVDRYISWKNGFLTLDKTPMTEVLQQVGRYYNLSFDFNQDTDLQKRTCTGKIYLSDNLDNVMTAIGLLSSTQYKKEGNKISISYKTI